MRPWCFERRPLIRDGAEQIRLWCAENGVPFTTDRTNLEPGCTRNILRLNVLPILRTVFPDPEAAVFRMTELLREDEAFLRSRAEILLPEGHSSMGRDALLALSPAEASRVLRRMAEASGGSVPEASHVRSVLDMARDDGCGSLSLPGKIRCVVDRETVRMEPESRDISPVAADGPGTAEIPADFPGGVVREDGFCRLLCFPDDGTEPFPTISFNSEENIYKSSISASLCFDKIGFTCRVRVRKPGDVIRFGGMTRRVKTLFSDRKLPAAVRASLPVIEDGEGLVWIPGFPPRDGLLWTGEGRRLTFICQFAGPLPDDCAAST